MLLSTLCAKAGIGDWRVYSAYHDAQKVVYAHGLVYVLSDGGLYSYDPDDTSIETYDKSKTLSDFGIADILLSDGTNELVVVYDNGNIDLLDSDGETYNISDLKLKTLDDKTINDACVEGTNMYLSLSGGIAVVDLKKRVFANYYSIGHTINSALIEDNKIYAMTTDGVYMGDMSLNLLNVDNWTRKISNNLKKVVSLNGTKFALTSSGVYKVATGTFNISRLTAEVLNYSSTANGVLYLSNGTKMYAADEEYNLTSCGDMGIYTLAYGGGTYWGACGGEGLKGYSVSGSDMTEKVASVIPDSPIRNASYSLVMEPDGRLLVAGGSFNYVGKTVDGTVMKYENGTWTNFDEEEGKAQVGSRWYVNLTDVVQDPNDSEHHFVGAVGTGLYEFRDYKLVNRYTYDNSPLTTILPDNVNKFRYVRITGLSYDDDGNLWMCNNECDTIIRILRKDNSWTSFYINEIAGLPTFDHIMFDQRGWAWINDRRSTSANNAGVLVVNPNGAIDGNGDISYKFITSIVNQDGTSYSPTLVTCTAEDLDGSIWVGTDVGPFVTYSPSKVFDTDFYFTQVKVPRNDGTNLADYLMQDVSVKCITVDAANRKWIGTSGSGVYLISADGLETIEHFTTDNSPLISDDICSIAINGATGEVFIGTEEGLVSYQGNATTPVSSFDKDLVKVFPNPVRPDYDGVITIRGLMSSSNVKIVNAAGRLVHEGTSTGGMYTWDGKTKSGKKAGSGIYFILAADSEGNDGVAAKFAIIK